MAGHKSFGWFDNDSISTLTLWKLGKCLFSHLKFSYPSEYKFAKSVKNYVHDIKYKFQDANNKKKCHSILTENIIKGVKIKLMAADEYGSSHDM